jgi:hypothetical protein
VFGLFGQKDEVAKFWRWFEKNAARIRQGVDRVDHRVIIHELGDRISRAAPGVVHEIGKPDPATVELILSADGIRASIPGVLALMEQAPRLESFLFTAFRPRGDGERLTIFDRSVGPGDLYYVSEAEGDALNLRVFLDGDWTEHERGTIGFLMLDRVLGEYDVMTGVGDIVFEAGQAPAGARPLPELAKAFDARRPIRAH